MPGAAQSVTRKGICGICQAGSKVSARSHNTEFLHPRPQGAGLQAEAAGGISVSLDLPAALPENFKDLLPLDFFEVPSE